MLNRYKMLMHRVKNQHENVKYIYKLKKKGINNKKVYTKGELKCKNLTLNVSQRK